MQPAEKIEINIKGMNGSEKLSPDNFDIKEIVDILENIEPLLYPNAKGHRPTISYGIEEGSVKNVFGVTAQAAAAFAAVLSLVNSSGSLDGLEPPTAKALEQYQIMARKRGYSFEFSSSTARDVLLSITPETSYIRSQGVWVETEMYFYGSLEDAGGKESPNIHLQTKEFGLIVISTDKDTLRSEGRNLLYKEYGVRALGLQNALTGELDKSSFKLVEILDYTPAFDESYINGLINKVGDKFKDVDVDEYISELRGSYA